MLLVLICISVVAKVCSYIQKGRKIHFMEFICDVLFAIFGVSFFITRIVIFPVFCVYDTWSTYGNLFGTDHALYWIWMVLLAALQSLHVFWFSIIAKMVVIMFTTDKVVEDIRSDDEFEDDDAGQQSSSREANRRTGSGSNPSSPPPDSNERKIAHKKSQ